MVVKEEVVSQVLARLGAEGWEDVEYVGPGEPDGRGTVLLVRGRWPADPAFELATWRVLVGRRLDDVTVLLAPADAAA